MDDSIKGLGLMPFGRVGEFVRQADTLRRQSEQSRGLFWSRTINRRVGAMIALILLPTRVTANMVTAASLIAHLVGAAIVVTQPAPASAAVIILVFLIWQLAFALDCADGQLARTRGTPSPFGAWLDQVLDHFAHTAVVTSLVLFAVRGVGLGAPESAALGALTVGGKLISFAAAQRNILLGARPAFDLAGNKWLRLLVHARQLTDHGAFLAVASIGLASPMFLLAVLIFASGATATVLICQVALNWVAAIQSASQSNDATSGPTARSATDPPLAGLARREPLDR